MPRLSDLSHLLEHGQPNFAWDPKLSGVPLNLKGRDGPPIRVVAVIP